MASSNAMNADDITTRVGALEAQAREARDADKRIERKVDEALEKLNQMIGERRGVKYVVGVGLTAIGVCIGAVLHWHFGTK